MPWLLELFSVGQFAAEAISPMLKLREAIEAEPLVVFCMVVTHPS
jgi:hypothetical protein